MPISPKKREKYLEKPKKRINFALANREEHQRPHVEMTPWLSW